MTRQDPEVSDHVKPGWRNRGAEPHQKLEGLEYEGACAVLPHVLQCELQAPVSAPLKPLLRQRRSHHVAAQPFELPSISAVNQLLGVDVDAERLGHGLVGSLLVTGGAGLISALD